MKEEDPRRYGISHEEIERVRAQGRGFVRMGGPCVGCGEWDVNHRRLRSHPSLPPGSCVPLGENCKPYIY